MKISKKPISKCTKCKFYTSEYIKYRFSIAKNKIILTKCISENKIKNNCTNYKIRGRGKDKYPRYRRQPLLPWWIAEVE